MIIRRHKNARYSPWDPNLGASDNTHPPGAIASIKSARPTPSAESPRPHRPDPGT